jgi:hypothetical protein
MLFVKIYLDIAQQDRHCAIVEHYLPLLRLIIIQQRLG